MHEKVTRSLQKVEKIQIERKKKTAKVTLIGKLYLIKTYKDLNLKFLPSLTREKVKKKLSKTFLLFD